MSQTWTFEVFIINVIMLITNASFFFFSVPPPQRPKTLFFLTVNMEFFLKVQIHIQPVSGTDVPDRRTIVSPTLGPTHSDHGRPHGPTGWRTSTVWVGRHVLLGSTLVSGYFYTVMHPFYLRCPEVHLIRNRSQSVSVLLK